MEIFNGENVKVDTSSIITYCRQLRQSRKYVPEEIWLEILSRLPIEPLLLSRSVCRLWRKLYLTLQTKINFDPLYVPVCGLLVLSLRYMGGRFGYFCFGTRESYITQFDSPEEDLIFSSGTERGLLSDLSFDFSMIHKITPESQFVSYVFHGGLLLVTLKDGTFEVHNPAINPIYYVPKSPTVEKYGFDKHFDGEKRGLIIQFPCYLDVRCHFIVVRFCVRLRIMEVYNNGPHEWVKYRLKLDSDLLRSLCIYFRIYVGFFENGVLSLYVLTSSHRGIAIKFKGPRNPEMKQYGFPLPQVVLENIYNTRIWECEKSLYLSYYNDTGLWIWKAGCTQVDAWTWVPILEISPTRQSCKPVAHELLSKKILNAGVRVMPLGFHPNVPLAYLLLESIVVAYNLNKDTLDMIGVIQNSVHYSDIVHTFKPCLSFMDVGKEWVTEPSAISASPPISWLVLFFQGR